jgi:acetolactate synthase-1/2/3 large subunit
VGELLARELPEGAIVCDEGVTGAARFRALSHQAAPHDSLSVPGGSIGGGIPLAIGAAIACPDRKVVNLQADGSGLYTVQGLWTEAREDLNVVTIVLANRAYAILQGELRNLGVNEVGRNATRMMSLGDPTIDWVQIAQGFGVEARRVETCEAFADVLSVAMRRRGPFLIECVV